jgi:hypothetical protein
LNSLLIFIASGALLIATLVGCSEDREPAACPEKGSSFFESSIAAHYRKQGKEAAATSFKLADGARYNSDLKWWTVPFDLDGKLMNALLSCDGHLELTIPPQ